MPPRKKSVRIFFSMGCSKESKMISSRTEESEPFLNFWGSKTQYLIAPNSAYNCCEAITKQKLYGVIYNWNAYLLTSFVKKPSCTGSFFLSQLHMHV